MTKGEALHTWFSSFGMKAYQDTNVPDKVAFPYITYSSSIGGYGEPVATTASIWYHTSSERIPNAKVDDISRAIGEEGVMLDCDDGKIWINKGTPFCISQTDANDSSVKLRFLNLTMKFFTL